MTRKRGLSEGWYPGSEAGVRRLCETWSAGYRPISGACACVAPHAGWSFSGRLAWAAVGSLAGAERGELPVTVVVVGGHLPPHAGIYAASDEAYATPLGNLPADGALLEFLRARLAVRQEGEGDNSVEVQLPFVKYHFPSASALWLRVAPSQEATALGTALFEARRALGRTLRVVGSTDLTHYGPGYRFVPRGSGQAAVQWVTEVSDQRMIDALLSMEGEQALSLSASERSACSCGAAVAALTFARLSGVRAGSLIDHYTSYDLHPADSFVGYAGIAYLR